MTIFIRKDITIIFNKSINGRETGLKVNRIGKGNLQIKILFIRETLIKISLRVQELWIGLQVRNILEIGKIMPLMNGANFK